MKVSESDNTAHAIARRVVAWAEEHDRWGPGTYGSEAALYEFARDLRNMVNNYRDALKNEPKGAA
jgi:hypothetical protein